MKNWFKVFKPKDGYTELVNKKNSPLEYIKFGVLRLKKGKSWSSSTKNEEAAIVVLSGTIVITIGCKEYKLGKRKDVWSGKPETLYLSMNEKYTIKALSDTEVAISVSPAKHKNDTVAIKQKNIVSRSAGKGIFTRDIYDIIKADSIKADRLIIGETYHRDGGWSCIPPHKHDVDRLPKEADLEELYFFKITPENGFGFERLYSEGEKRDNVWVLKNNTLLCMPEGYHALAVSPGYRLYYLWILAGKKRVLKQHFDPRYDWLNK